MGCLWCNVNKRRVKRRFWPLIMSAAFGIILLYSLNVTENGSDTVDLPIDVNLSSFELFEPEVFSDLDLNSNGVPKIERIIHQTWKNQKIPSNFAENVRSFVRNHPSWKYYLWTDESARKLIVDFYPQFLSVWDSISYSKHTIRRADALRYIVLYHYGGVYADLDVLNFRSLENAITSYPCVFTPEPYEHAVIRTFSPYLLSNAIMLCSSGHPFLRQLIENLFTTEYYTNSVDSTGPGYVTTQYLLYNDLPREADVRRPAQRVTLYSENSPYFNKGSKYAQSSHSYVYIANTRYFIYSLDETLLDRLRRECSQWFYLDHLHRRACANVKVLGFHRGRHKFAFTEHQWYMTWINWKNTFAATGTDYFSVDIAEIVPDVVIYDNMV